MLAQRETKTHRYHAPDAFMHIKCNICKKHGHYATSCPDNTKTSKDNLFYQPATNDGIDASGAVSEITTPSESKKKVVINHDQAYMSSQVTTDDCDPYEYEFCTHSYKVTKIPMKDGKAVNYNTISDEKKVDCNIVFGTKIDKVGEIDDW